MIESIAVFIVLGALFGLVMSLAKFSPSPAYLLAGFVATLLGVSNQSLVGLAEFGVVLLLFAVGIEIDIPKVFRSFRIVVVAVLQMAGSFAATFFIGNFLGFSGADLLIMSLAFMFSSTAVVLKTLSDKGLLDSAIGEASTGILITQDIVAAIVISFISPSQVSVSGLILLVIFLVFSKKLFDFTLNKRTPLETVFIMAIAAMMGASALAGYSGLSYGMGALLAGIALSFAESRHELSSLLNPLKNFFLLLFFSFMGGFVQMENYAHLIFSIIPLIVTPLLVFVLLKLFKFPSRISAASSMSLANLSGFSLILVWLAYSMNMVSYEVVSIVALTAMISMIISPIALQLFLKIKGFESSSKGVKAKVLLFGAHTTGRHILKELKHKDLMIVDASPSHVRFLRKKEHNAIIGDVGNAGFLSSLGIENSRLIISTVPALLANMTLLEYLRSKNSDAVVMVVSHNEEDARRLSLSGADAVIIPKKLAGRHISEFVRGLRF